MVDDTCLAFAASPPGKLPRRGIIAVIGTVSFLAVLLIANLDQAGKACAGEGSLVAAAFCFETMTSIESLLGIRSERLANAYTDLSLCYFRQDRIPEAMRAQEKAIAMQKRITSAESPIVLILTANLARYKSKALDYANAEAMLMDSLSRAEALSPANPYAVGFTLNALLDTYSTQKKWKEAEEVARRLIAVDEQLVGCGLCPFWGREGLAEVYAKSGRLLDAEREARLALNRGASGSLSIGTAPAHEALGKILVLEGRQSDAKHEFDSSYQELLGKFGDCDKTRYWKARYNSYLLEKNPYKE